jgi:creatinine amidohydrolase
MTEFFAFENLTWPEVYQLRRNIPLVIPLGNDYSQVKLSEQLGNPPEIGMLPAIPYGWNRSVLPVSPTVLENALWNLIQGLREDGFSQVFTVTPPDIGFSKLGPFHLTLPPDSPRIAPSFFSLDSLSKVVIIPVGHIEQHGFHLPLSTDTLIIDAIRNGIEKSAPDLIVCLPTMPYGVSTHRSSFAGTLNMGGRAFEDFWLDVIDFLVNRGYEKMFFINGHGGNSSFLVNTVKYVGEKYPNIFCATTWLYLSGPKGIAVLDNLRQSTIGGMGHACELETSMILHLHPKLVSIQRVVDEMDFISTPSYFMDWVEGGALIANPPWDDDTATGAYGAGSLGSAEKGKTWLTVAIEEKVDQVKEIIEQYERRKARRENGFGLWGGKPQISK